MPFISIFYDALQDILSFHSYSDYIEILILTSVIYFFQKWLSLDTQKNLLLLFHCYCFFLISIYYYSLPTISLISFYSIPLVFLFFIIIHQNTLQKNFITLQKIADKPSSLTINWIQELVQLALQSLNLKRDIIFVIEGKESLTNLISCSSAFYADFKKDIIEILLDKHIVSPHTFVWLTYNGKCVSINNTWNYEIEKEFINQNSTLNTHWKLYGGHISLKTDALIFKINSLSRNFDVILKGKIVEQISAEQLLKILIKYCETQVLEESTKSFKNNPYTTNKRRSSSNSKEL